jgi:hypothetical protein
MSNGGIPGRLVEFIRSRVFGTRSQKQLNHQTNNMKKIVLLAVAIALTSVGIGYSMNVHQLKEQGKCECGVKCSSCNGTGWQGQFRCTMCKGTGANGSY